MKLDIKPGRYVVAVSGGVDSVVLLHLLQQLRQEDPRIELVVAHVDHGIREDSARDLAHVQSLADQYTLPFYATTLSLGAGTSEETARNARYAFLESVQKDVNGDGIITAHHQDDLVETALLNVLRGTNRKGLTSLASTDQRIRPLLGVPKRHIVAYAKANGLVWHEDSTNQQTVFTRNALRHQIVPKMTPLQRQHLLAHIRHTQQVNRAIDHELANILHAQNARDTLDRQTIIRLPFAVAIELMAAWLRREGVRDFNRRHLSRLVVAARTYSPGQRIDVNKDRFIIVNTRSLALIPRNC